MLLRGSIFMANMPMIQNGSVQDGYRPVIVVQNNKGNAFSPTVQVIPLTTRKKKELPMHTKVKGYGLERDSVALIEQIQTISKKNLHRYIGCADGETMKKIDNCLAIQLGLSGFKGRA